MNDESKARQGRTTGADAPSESGAWGTAAIATLLFLFVLAAAAMAHSVIVTFF